MTKFVFYAWLDGLITTSMSKWAMWHDFSFLERREERKKKRNVGVKEGTMKETRAVVMRKKQESKIL